MFTILVLFISLPTGCATSFEPRPADQVGFMERVQTQIYSKVTVSVAVPSIEESRELFDVKLDKEGVQPIWVRIQNGESIPIIFMQLHMDSGYYSPAEASYKTRFKSSKKLSLEKDKYFQEKAFPGITIPPGSDYSGFVFVNLDEGTKGVVVTLMGPKKVKSFVFIVPVPGFRADYLERDINNVYPEEEYLDFNDGTSLRVALEGLPRAVTNEKGTAEGDPLNLVLIGEFEDMVAAFTIAGWDETHALYVGTALKTTSSFIFRKAYRYSPVSSLYVFGRPQDVSFQKSRESIHERNHMRFWKTSYRFKGISLWIGQISRDIGIKYTLKTGFLTTHKIDPDVDKDRGYVFQDLIDSQAVNAIGFVKGVEEAPFSEPRYNLGDDPYFTDGLRGVFYLSDLPVPFGEIKFMQWDFPPIFDEYRDRWFGVK